MLRALDLLDELGDVVEAHAGTGASEVARVDCEALPPHGRLGQPASQQVVDDVPEGAPRASRQKLYLCSHVVVQGQRRSHILMLIDERHDVHRQRGRRTTMD